MLCRKCGVKTAIICMDCYKRGIDLVRGVKPEPMPKFSRFDKAWRAQVDIPVRNMLDCKKEKE